LGAVALKEKKYLDTANYFCFSTACETEEPNEVVAKQQLLPSRNHHNSAKYPTVSAILRLFV
jgi:hypothetical protein